MFEPDLSSRTAGHATKLTAGHATKLTAPQHLLDQCFLVSYGLSMQYVSAIVYLKPGIISDRLI